MRASIIHDFQVLLKTEEKKGLGRRGEGGGSGEHHILTHTKTLTASMEQLGRANFPLGVVITERLRAGDEPEGSAAAPSTREQTPGSDHRAVVKVPKVLQQTAAFQKLISVIPKPS